jgi:hypothetical protein
MRLGSSLEKIHSVRHRRNRRPTLGRVAGPSARKVCQSHRSSPQAVTNLPTGGHEIPQARPGKFPRSRRPAHPLSRTGADCLLEPKLILGSHLPPARGLTQQLLANLELLPDAPLFTGPDQAAMERMLAELTAVPA